MHLGGRGGQLAVCQGGSRKAAQGRLMDPYIQKQADKEGRRDKTCKGIQVPKNMVLSGFNMTGLQKPMQGQ